ncbi:hypothetical protein Tcan_00288 [Toxocara canis]|uniref:Uncharacterized protein n=2 Tax=Toxocara canis TaxID=6265 RepID=A0A0B2VLP7_TOXCA|nr:hypothetical protein Tcan_00288 [Toxocara canis]VDM47064.1 unnamed protein product [Toxocara canis]
MDLDGFKYYLFQFYQLIVVIAIVCVAFIVYLLRSSSPAKENDSKKTEPRPSGLKQPEVRTNLRSSQSKPEASTSNNKKEASSEEEEEEGEVVTPRKRRIISEITVSSS